jgi:RNA polymerase sigma-70 factor (ECF subfamily)
VVSEPERLPTEEETERGEAALVKASAAGDQDAFRQLVERYRQLVLRVAMRSTGDASLAEDVAQEAFIKVYRGLPAYRPDKPFVHWLHRVVANTVTDELRRRRPVDSLDDMNQPPASAEQGPQEVADHHAVQEAVRLAISELPPRYRDIILLQVFHEMTYAEIARRLRLPLGTVMWRMNMAKRLLRKRLSDAGQAPGVESDRASG